MPAGPNRACRRDWKQESMNTPFSGWREGLPHYLPWFVVALVVTVVFRSSNYGWAAVPLWLLAFGILLFFRDFPRTAQAQPNEVISPADGTVVAIEHLQETPHYDGPALRISIFMSVFNVHVNRAPYDGEVRDVRYAPGAYKNAMKPESSKINESNALWLDTDRGLITVRQISGAVARRIVCRAQPGTRLQRGEKFGMIKFGSRVEVYLPPEAVPLVALKDKPRGGITVLARFP